MIKGLGRRPQFDERSRNFPIRTMIAQKKPRSYSWSCPIVLDQGQEGACAGFSFSHEAAARPAKVPDIDADVARQVYRRAKQLDPWPDDDSYEGTSVLAAVQACVERGWYTSYRWAFGLEDVLLALSYQGPVVLGINWYEGMAEPDENGFLQVTGNIVGGHAIATTANSQKKRAVRVLNTWGPEWGQDGTAWISHDDLRRLLSEQGEACVPIGRKVPLLGRIAAAIMNRLPGA